MIFETLIENLIKKRISVDVGNNTFQRHICAIIREIGKNINIMSIGYNIRRKLNGVQTYHAEEEAILKLLKHQGMTKIKGKVSLVVIRISQNSNDSNYKLSMSKPCCDCVKLISGHNIKNIYYSTDNGILKESLSSIKYGLQHIPKYVKNSENSKIVRKESKLQKDRKD